MGYKAKPVDQNALKKANANAQAELTKAPSTKNSAKIYAEARDRATKAERLVIVDFWAPWCAPCKKLKKVTLSNNDVIELLGDIEIVYINLDEHAELGKAFGVTTIPDVFFIAPDGTIVDRLKKFEDVKSFKMRLKKLLSD